MSILYIQLEDLTLQFRVLATPVAELWQERMAQRHAWPLDHPKRFYGFDSAAQEKIRALNDVRRCVDTINQHSYIIDRALTTVDDQDTLNYLHNIGYLFVFPVFFRCFLLHSLKCPPVRIYKLSLRVSH